ncbi:MAG: HAD family hydrolase [Thiolinea sp.]
MSIRCVCFDLDDTLWDCEAVISRAEQQLYQWLTVHQPRISERYSPAELINSRISFTRQNPELHYDLGKLRRSWLSELAAEAELETDWVEAAFEHFLQARNQVDFFPGVLEQLQQLRQENYILGSITNGNADVHSVGLGDIFHFSHNSASAGVSKPHPAIFEQALEISGLQSHQMVYVGDDPEKDIIGASSAGLRTIWYNPFRRELSRAATPDAIMTSFNQLAFIVRTL